jgi:cysteine desulfurase/selenocysteine lyase
MEITPISQLEIQRFRAETRGTAGRIHFNNAGASLQPDPVVDTVINYLQEEAIYGGYETEYKYREPLENTYSLIARMINADREEVSITENASFAWGLAFNGIDFKKGDVVLTSEFEYATNVIGFLNLQHTAGITIKVIPNDEQGNFSLPALEAALSPQTKLLAITHIPSGAGGTTPIVEIGKIARKHQILYLVDACQSIGQAPVDVREIDCDMLSVNGRKFLRAPRGTGFLYVRKAVQDRLKLLFMDGHSTQWISEQDFKPRDDARRFELYEKNRALALGMGKAIEYALQIGMDRIWQRIQWLATILRRQLASIGGVTVHDKGSQQSGIVTFSVNGIDSPLIRAKLSERNINTSVGAAQSTLFYMNKNRLPSTVRASLHYYNTEEEIRQFCEALESIIKLIRRPVGAEG